MENVVKMDKHGYVGRREREGGGKERGQWSKSGHFAKDAKARFSPRFACMDRDWWIESAHAHGEETLWRTLNFSLIEPNCASIEIMARCVGVIDLSIVRIPRETRISMLITVERINRILERDGTICNKEERSRCSRWTCGHNTVKVHVWESR